LPSSFFFEGLELLVRLPRDLGVVEVGHDQRVGAIADGGCVDGQLSVVLRAGRGGLV